ncbi:MAG: hypothetical protein WAQ27_01430 [Candidatus Microsaccharimonas sp.]
MAQSKKATFKGKAKLFLGVAFLLALGVGYFVFFSVQAAPGSLESEAGTVSSNAVKKSDVTASNGQAVAFGSAAPGGFQANCIATPSACGYPDTTNTGVLPGVTRTSSGSVTISTNGAVFENKNVTGQIVVTANNVTIRNVRITSPDYYPIDYSGTGLLVENTEIIGTSDAVTACMSFDNYIARRVNCSGGADGFKANSNVTIEDSYITGLRIGDETHNDGIQTTGGSNVTIRRNTIDVRGISAEVMQLGIEWSANSNWTVDGNLLAGGGWVFNGGPVNPMTITNNRFAGTRAYGIGSVSGATYTNNYYDSTGSAVCINNGC